ncbi:hypothetical protein K523DRAFT_391421 [Schizophyllum commune Tattone D]|nr:hypothetical protein K523DRAFT_391421 [Schizophyllum commune Tattone D]
MGVIEKMISAAVLWLHLKAGVSRDVANGVLRIIHHIVSTTLFLVTVSLRLAGLRVKLTPSLDIPRDVRTLYARAMLEPVILRTACCPKCFYLYSENIPLRCEQKESRRSRRTCNTELWAIRQTRHGPKWVPRRLYSVQCFDSWLRWFLSRKIIDDALNMSYQQGLNNAAPNSALRASGIMRDVRDSPAWRDIQGPLQSPYQLVFSVYADWFNPFTNKIAGKVASCGVIALYCLNLPPHLRYRLENVYIAGITPPPHAPSFLTISHILQPFVQSMLPFRPPGRSIATFGHPDGVMVSAKSIPLIMDMQASKKITGYTSHASGPHCSHYTKKEREHLAREYGVRWTPFYDLDYYDPAKHVVIGFMHNWLEGICQHHLRDLWGIGRDILSKLLRVDVDEDEQWSLADEEESAEELSDLDAERAEAAEGELDDSDVEAEEQAMDELRSRTSLPPIPADLSAEPSMSSFDGEYIPVDLDEPFAFSPHELQFIRTSIRNILRPSSMERPPTNLGEASHGKLKAQVYLTLFTLDFPLILPLLWWRSPDPIHGHLLGNLHNLVSALNIVSAFETSNEEADKYTAHYTQYPISKRSLFPNHPSRPNHHYAMHIGELLKYWGPLPALSEFPGERMNGMLQKIKTNHHLSTWYPKTLQFYAHMLQMDWTSLCSGRPAEEPALKRG